MSMSAREYVRLNDRNHGVNRSTTRSNAISCFPTNPAKKSAKSTNLSQLGTPGALIRRKDDFSTKNYDNKKNLEELTKLFSQAQQEIRFRT